MAMLIEALHATDRDFASVLGVEIRPTLILERVEAGSIRAILRTIINGLPDESLQHLDWKPLVGQYLVRAKQRMLAWLADNPSIRTREDLSGLQKAVIADVPGFEPGQLFLPSPVPAERLLSDVKRISEAMEQLSSADQVSFEAAGTSTPISPDVRISSEQIEVLLTQESRTSDVELILLVKRPDYLGRSRWEFRHEDHVLEAKIVDDDWLERFRDGVVVLRPGDALRARVRSEVHIGFEGQIVGARHTVLEVLEVVRGTQIDQGDLLADGR